MLDQISELELPSGGDPNGSTHGDMGNVGGSDNLSDPGREYKAYEAFFDGACGPPNPGGPAAYGAVIYCDGRSVWECAEPYVPPAGTMTSSNSAEYAGLIAVLRWFTSNLLTDAPITIHGDSALVINQTFGNWRIKDGFYAPLAREAKELRSLFSNINGRWISRGENVVADELSKRAMPAELRNYDWAARGTEQHGSRPEARRQKQWSWPKKFNLNKKPHIELAAFFVLDARVANDWERKFLSDIRDRPSLSQKQAGTLNALVAKARSARQSSGATP